MPKYKYPDETPEDLQGALNWAIDKGLRVRLFWGISGEPGQDSMASELGYPFVYPWGKWAYLRKTPRGNRNARSLITDNLVKVTQDKRIIWMAPNYREPVLVTAYAGGARLPWYLIYETGFGASCHATVADMEAHLGYILGETDSFSHKKYVSVPSPDATGLSHSVLARYGGRTAAEIEWQVPESLALHMLQENGVMPAPRTASLALPSVGVATPGVAPADEAVDLFLASLSDD